MAGNIFPVSGKDVSPFFTIRRNNMKFISLHRKFIASLEKIADKYFYEVVPYITVFLIIATIIAGLRIF